MTKPYSSDAKAKRERASYLSTEVMTHTEDRWALFVFLAFFVALLGIIAWLSISEKNEVGQSSLSTVSSSPDFAINEPIQPIQQNTNLNKDKVLLGQRLFYETKFSEDNDFSCAHCHDITKGGADNLIYSKGNDGLIGHVNALSIFNLSNNIAFTWNGRAASLEEQLDIPITSPYEMNTNWDAITSKLKSDPSYVEDFNRLYVGGISKTNIKNTLVSFLQSLNTPNSPFDRYLLGDHHAIDEAEKKGYQLFKNYGCSSCHQGANVGGNLFQVFGVVGNYFEDRGNITEADLGRYNVTGREIDRHRFRVPSLRNIALTAPYFHDGSATTLEEAIYIMAEYQLGRKIPQSDVDLIIRFLHTLTGQYIPQE